MAIDIPYEFEQFVKGFYPSSTDGITTLEQWIQENLGFFDQRSRDVIRQFLDELLSGRHTDREIEEDWRRQYPSHDFRDGGHRPFLTRVRDLLGDR